MTNYNKQIKSHLEHILGNDVGYKRYREINEVFANEIRGLWEIIELREIKHTILIKTPKDERNELREALALQRMFAIYGRQPKNLCTQFKVEGELHAISFNTKYNLPKYRYIFYKEKDMTKLFVDDIIWRVKNTTNVIIVISGPPNSGKSESAQTISKFIQYQFREIKNKKINIKIAFSTADFYKKIKLMKFGDVGIRDETPKLTGKGSHLVEWYLNNITKMIRANMTSFLFVDPKEIRPDVVSFFLETAGKWKKEEITRYILYDKDHTALGHVYIPLHNDKEFRKEYERKKMENIRIVKESRGEVSPELEQKSELKDNPVIVSPIGDTGTDKGSTQAKKNIFEDFKWNYDLNKIIEIVKREAKWRNTERDFEIYFKRQKGRLLKDIADDYNELETYQAVEKIVKKVRGYINHINGLVLEKKYEKYLKSLKEFKDWRIKRVGLKEHPDIVMTKDNRKIVLSLKNLELKQGKIKYVNIKDYEIERLYSLDQVKDNFKIETYLIVFNNLDNSTRLSKIDILNPKNIRVN